jgi:hypothetical protein
MDNIFSQFKRWIFLRLLCVCYRCKNGYLIKVDSYIHGPQMIIDIYKCSECGNREGVNK